MKKNLSYQKALASLREVISSYTRNGTKKLPICQKLAVSANVSYLTMWRALQQLKSEGLLSTAPGRGILINDPQMFSSRHSGVVYAKQLDSPRLKCERLKNQIKSDLVNGVFPDKVLPSTKDLMDRYGVCYKTLKKALDVLVEEKQIVQDKYTYRNWSVGKRNRWKSIVVITYEQLSGGFSRNDNHLEILEREFSKLQLRLRVFRAYEDIDQNELASVIRDSTVAGVIIWGVFMTNPQGAQILEILNKSDKPVALLDETEELYIPGEWPELQLRFKVFPFAYTSLCGERIGRFLIDKGHRSIAYFSPNFPVWSQNRFRGLQKAFSSVGTDSSVRLFTMDVPDFSGQFFDPFFKRLGLQQSLVFTSDTYSKELSPFSIRQIEHAIMSNLRYEISGDLFKPVFIKALEQKEITAWVGDNDETALGCLHFLRQQGIRVPERISVIGFDNLRSSHQRELTTFDFNAAAHVRAMADFILNMAAKKENDFPRIAEEIEGFIVERSTTDNAGQDK